MSLIDKLERNYEYLGIPNLTRYLLGGHIFAYVLVQMNPELRSFFELTGSAVYSGEYWRIILLLFQPTFDNTLFVIFAWYLFYLYGTALEEKWGSFRYTFYIALAYIGTIITALVFPGIYIENGYIYLSVFLAFAYLFPDFKLLIFFVLPVKVKWLAYLAWAGTIISILTNPIGHKVLALVSISNFLLFFGRDLIQSLSLNARGVTLRSKGLLESKKPIHICTVCKRNEVKNPDMEIRYCSKCVPELCYCEDHIHNHKHRVIN